MATNVVINNNQTQTQPQPQPPALIAIHSHQWSTGICDCFNDLPICCFAYWCFPCFACSTASDFGECFCLPLMDIVWYLLQLVLLPSCTPPVSLAMRVAVRNRYGIQGDITGDCVYSTFCNICSWCQIAREIKRRTQPFSVITAQPMLMGAQPYMMAAQPAVVTTQPMIATAPQGVMIPTIH